MATTTVLVLGAGASKAYGFPLGLELRRKIIELGTLRLESEQTSRICDGSCAREDFAKFAQEFAKSHRYSIDDFLARRTEFVDVGKKAIASVLLRCERQKSLDEAVDDWYAYLLNRVANCAWDELDFARLKIVTFNYDRSLEHFLLSALRSTYGKGENEVIAKLRSLEIVHVYGVIGPALPGSENYTRYGSAERSIDIKRAAEGINIVPEGRDTDPAILRARELLVAARQIAFMGFGFDSSNLARLDASNTCRAVLNNGGSRTRRRVVATSMGLTKAEVVKVAGPLYADSGHYPGVENPRDFFDSDCLTMLRETLILG